MTTSAPPTRGAWSVARSRCCVAWGSRTLTGACDAMTKDLNATGRWLKRLTQGLAAEPQDRQELLTILRDAGERAIVDTDALGMIEGVLEVSDLKVRDIMVPRAQ